MGSDGRDYGSNKKELRELILLEEACGELQNMTILDTVDFRHHTSALQDWVQSIRSSLEVQNRVTILRIRAERQIGKMLAEMNLRGGNRRGKDKNPSVLENLGIGRAQSQHWQRLARIPDDAVEQYFEEAQEEPREITTAGLLRLATPTKKGSRSKARKTQQVSNAEAVSFKNETLQSSSKEINQVIEEIKAHCVLLRSMLQPICDGANKGLKRGEKKAVLKYLLEVEELANSLEVLDQKSAFNSGV